LIFLDTSAIYAWTDRGDPRHAEARERLAAVLEGQEALVTHNYVLVEAMSLVQSRLGMAAALKLAGDARAFEVEWVDRAAHQEAVRRWEQRGRRQVSFVDEVSFLIMRRRGIRTAFAFDADFGAEGFAILGGRA
jgi:predicted nucleic acid-binding protein